MMLIADEHVKAKKMITTSSMASLLAALAVAPQVAGISTMRTESGRDHTAGARFHTQEYGHRPRASLLADHAGMALA